MQYLILKAEELFNVCCLRSLRLVILFPGDIWQWLQIYFFNIYEFIIKDVIRYTHEQSDVATPGVGGILLASSG